MAGTGRGLKGHCPADLWLPKEGLITGGGESGAGQGQFRVFITTGWDPRSVEEMTTLFRPAIFFFPSAGLFGFFPEAAFIPWPLLAGWAWVWLRHTPISRGSPALGFLPLFGQADWRKTALKPSSKQETALPAS